MPFVLNAHAVEGPIPYGGAKMQDPYEASLFYVPANVMMYTIEYYDPVPHMTKVRWSMWL
jgi:hypothetical protein